MEGITIGLTAFGLGVLHALEPGHGKTLMAGTLVGSKHRWLDPIMLAVSTAVGHAIGIVFFVIVSFWIAHEFAAEELRHTVELVSGMVVLSVGAILSFKTASAVLNKSTHKIGCAC